MPTTPESVAPVVSPIANLEKAADMRRRLEDNEYRMIATARAAGHTWAEIGAALGKTRASAQQWYAARERRSGR